MRAEAYIEGLLEELRQPRSKAHESSIRAELARLGIQTPSAKAIKAQSSQSQAAPAPTAAEDVAPA